jgi:single-strand DNA-binding protein
MATSRSLNKVMLIGNLSRDPVVRTTASGATVCTFGIATNAAWRDENKELQERTEFHNIVAWNKLAEICAQILSVGMLVYLEGEIRTRTWDDENGQRHYRSEIRISDMKLLDSKGKSGIGIEQARSDNNEGERQEKNSTEKPSPDRGNSEKRSNQGDEVVAEEDLPF